VSDSPAGQQRVVTPVLNLASPKQEFGADLPLNRAGQWHYLGVTLNNRTGEALFCVDGLTTTARFHGPVLLKGATAHIGGKRPAKSQLAGFTGDMRFVAVYAGGQLGPEEHEWLHNQFAKELGRPELPSAVAPRERPLVWMSPRDAEAFDRNFILPTEDDRGGSEVVTFDGLRALRVRDQGSVGVDLDVNHRDRGDKVVLRFRFRIERGAKHTLCTVGDFNQPARLVARAGQVFLCAGKTEKCCGNVSPGGWTSVSLETWRDRARASVGDGDMVEVEHRPVATWVYLGEGFPEYGKYPGTRFLIAIASVNTSVER